MRKVNEIRCSYCNSDNINNLDFQNERFCCHNCGALFLNNDDDYEELDLNSESIFTCPHCESSNCLEVQGDSEYCKECGLDPNIYDLPASELVHLWKKPSRKNKRSKLISEAMLKNPHLFDASRPRGKFLRTSCGPHCPIKKHCPQTITDFANCFQEYQEEDLFTKEVFVKKEIPKDPKILTSYDFSKGGWYPKIFRQE